MNKKLIIAAMAVILAVSAAGCAKKADNNTPLKNTEQTDASGAYDGNTVEEVDMDKVDGEEATSDSKKADYDGELGNVAVTIEDAKIITYDGEDVAVVSFKFTNKADTDQPFTSSLLVNAYQNNGQLRPTVVTGVEGINLMAQSEYVKPGDTITVQKTFALEDKSPLTVEVLDFAGGQTNLDPLVKVFNF